MKLSSPPLRFLETHDSANHRPESKNMTWMSMLIAALALLIGTVPAFSQRPMGIDVSSYQGSPNWTSVRNSGITFAWAKATEGTSINDGSFTYNQNNGKAAGVYMGAYHFAHPNLNSPASEASHFWAVAGPYIKADGKTLMPVLDFEVFSGVVGASSYSDWANQWCNAIVGYAAAAGVTVRPILYTSACSACNFNGSVAQWSPWIANYNGQNPQSGNPWNVCGGCNIWGGWNAWQYSSSGAVAGIAGNVDLDVFNGSTAALVSTFLVHAPSVASTLGDYDGDAKPDAAVWRPSNGTFWISGTKGTPWSVSYGINGDIPVPMDYDADGKTDAAVYRPSTGTWYIQSTSHGSWTVGWGGNAGDIPIPADYDGDGKPDAAIYRPSTGEWFISSTSHGSWTVGWGGNAGDIPVPMDYDADGKADAAIFRPSTGEWFISSTGHGSWTVYLGQTGDVPVPADYDGDGFPDAAIYRPSTGTWYIQSTSHGSWTVGWGGNAGDIPVPRDYDADGRTDAAIFRPSTGEWFISSTSHGSWTTQWGINGDLPLQVSAAIRHCCFFSYYPF